MHTWMQDPLASGGWSFEPRPLAWPLKFYYFKHKIFLDPLLE